MSLEISKSNPAPVHGCINFLAKPSWTCVDECRYLNIKLISFRNITCLHINWLTVWRAVHIKEVLLNIVSEPKLFPIVYIFLMRGSIWRIRSLSDVITGARQYFIVNSVRIRYEVPNLTSKPRVAGTEQKGLKFISLQRAANLIGGLTQQPHLKLRSDGC